ncbi:UvrD-helicase domain-containing protein, partial [Janibacter corallicola]|uniref:UvrD-helicase domain-containing protein n=1 Tax=Janibacter corallicola TaxID=415212 RepID=UPI000B2D03EC
MTEQEPAVALRRRTTAAEVPRHDLDADQAAAVAARGDLLRVLGGPGTGKSSVAVAAVLDRVAKGECLPSEVLLVAATRLSA